MTMSGEQGYKRRVGATRGFRSEGLVHMRQMGKTGVDPRAAGLSELEIGTMNRMDSGDVRNYDNIAQVGSEQYLVQEYIRRMEMGNEEPDQRVIDYLMGGELD